MNTTAAQSFHAADVPIAEPEAASFATPGDLARRFGKSAVWIKHVASELRLPEIRTGAGIRLFPPAQAAAIGRELERREREAFK